MARFPKIVDGNIQDTEAFRQHIEVIRQNADELLALENEFEELKEKIRKIKDSSEWNKAYTYFFVMKNRGYISESACRENGYTIRLNDGRKM